MKRHQRLQDLSREHHGALQLAWQAKRAALSSDQESIEAAGAACLTALASELEDHFIVEETTLLPLLVRYGDNELLRRFESDHRELRRFSTLLPRPDAATLLGFAERLTSHVRFEEREMFVVLEAHFLNT